jgi:hypothetical protein
MRQELHCCLLLPAALLLHLAAPCTAVHPSQLPLAWVAQTGWVCCPLRLCACAQLLGQDHHLPLRQRCEWPLHCSTALERLPAPQLGVLLPPLRAPQQLLPGLLLVFLVHLPRAAPLT